MTKHKDKKTKLTHSGMGKTNVSPYNVFVCLHIQVMEKFTAVKRLILQMVG